MPDRIPHAVVVENEVGPIADAEAEVARLRAVSSKLPTILIDRAEVAPEAATVPLSTEPLFAYTHPQGTQPLARLPVVVTYSGAEVRLTTEWDGTTWAFPLTWTALTRAPLCAGWEVRQEVRISPHLESSTPYLVFRIPTYGLVVAIHPNAVRVLASSLSRLVKA